MVSTITAEVLASLREFNVELIVPQKSKIKSKRNELNLTGPQMFAKNIFNPNTDMQRCLLKWQTGVGKSIGAISIASEFIKQYRQIIPHPSVIVIGFSWRETIQEDMLRWPEFGFISQEELFEKERIKKYGDNKQLSTFMASIKRRITDKNKGGYYKFFGYKEFSNHLFVNTSKGNAQKFDVANLTKSEESFIELIAKAERDGLIKVNTELIELCKHSLIICDEIHNTYNINHANNYGLAIQYIMDILPPDERPRLLILSATPLTGSASEVVDVLNLVVPIEERNNKRLLRSDFFVKTTNSIDDENFVVSQLRPDAKEKLAKYFRGHVSFLLDMDTESYPIRKFAGVNYPGIPYIKITECPMSELHLETFKARGTEYNNGLSTGDYTLYDMVFPGGLYKSTEIQSMESTEEVTIKREEFYTTYSGPWLKLDELKKYSTKYYTGLKLLLDKIIKGERTKVLMYHSRVRLSGVLIWQEIFKENGFIDEFDLPNSSTICVKCGMNEGKHTTAHQFIPARFAIVHSEVEKSVMAKSIYRFNSPLNINGEDICCMIGSSVIEEGINFHAASDLFIFSLPNDYPSLIQVIGRVVRKNSHIDLPVDQREVTIHTFVTAIPKEMGIGPEIKKYMEKGQEYLVIQEVNNIINKSAIDSFMNYDSIHNVIGNEPSLEDLPYPRVVSKKEQSQLINTTFYAYGYSEYEVNSIIACCKILFNYQNVWKLPDLKAALKDVKTYYDMSMITNENFALAIDTLMSPIEGKIVVKIDDYFIMTSLDSLGKPIIDIESYIRSHVKIQGIKCSLNKYIQKIDIKSYMNIYIDKINDKYLSSHSIMPLELCLIEFNDKVHYYILDNYTTNTNKITIDDAKMKKLYTDFKLLLKIDNILCYDHRDYISCGDKHLPKHTDERRENNIVIGVSTPDGKLKLRPPLTKIKVEEDERFMIRGVVCETNSREKLEEIFKKIKTLSLKHGKGEHNGFDQLNIQAAIEEYTLDAYLTEGERTLAARIINVPKSRVISTSELCFLIKKIMMELERASRIQGANGQRWVYLFNDQDAK